MEKALSGYDVLVHESKHSDVIVTYADTLPVRHDTLRLLLYDLDITLPDFCYLCWRHSCSWLYDSTLFPLCVKTLHANRCVP